MQTFGLIDVLTAACRHREEPTSGGMGMTYMKGLVPQIFWLHNVTHFLHPLLQLLRAETRCFTAETSLPC